MRSRRIFGGLSAGLLALQALGTQSCRSDEPEGKDPQAIAIAVVESDEKTGDEPDGDVKVRVEVNRAEEAQLPKLWLGIALKSVDGDLAAFLGSSEGVLIDNVAPDSPAAKAGVQKGDVVISVDGKQLAEPKGLLDVMSSATEGVALKLKVLRKSEHLEISVTPEMRKVENQDIANRVKILRKIEGVPGSDVGEVELQWTPQDGTDPDKSVHVYRLGEPSVLFVPDNIELKGNISIHMTKENDGKTVEIKISKESDKPAEITVKQGDQVEKLTEEQLDKLPEELRDWVKSALSGKKAKWVDLKAAFADRAGDASIQLKDFAELKELSELLDTGEFQQGKAEVKKMIEELTRNAKSQAHEALKKAMEQAGVDAEQPAQQAKELALKYAEQALGSAKSAAEQSKISAKEIHEKARAQAEELKKAASQSSQSEQISELKALIEQLQKEIAELRGSK